MIDHPAYHEFDRSEEILLAVRCSGAIEVLKQTIEDYISQDDEADLGNMSVLELLGWLQTQLTEVKV